MTDNPNKSDNDKNKSDKRPKIDLRGFTMMNDYEDEMNTDSDYDEEDEKDEEDDLPVLFHENLSRPSKSDLFNEAKPMTISQQIVANKTANTDNECMYIS